MKVKMIVWGWSAAVAPVTMRMIVVCMRVVMFMPQARAGRRTGLGEHVNYQQCNATDKTAVEKVMSG